MVKRLKLTPINCSFWQSTVNGGAVGIGENYPRPKAGPYLPGVCVHSFHPLSPQAVSLVRDPGRGKFSPNLLIFKQ